MNDQPNTPSEETPKKKGDCLTPSATMLALLIAIVYMAGRWLLA